MLKKIALICAILAAALIIPAILICLWSNYQAPKALEAARQRLRDMGAPMTFEEVLPAPVPDEQNAAPLYLKLEELVENSPEFEQADQLIEDEIFGEDYLKDWNHIHRMELNDEEWKSLTAAIQLLEQTAYFDLVERIAERPYFRPDHDYTQGPALMIPEVSKARNASQYLLAQAALAHRKNDSEAFHRHLAGALQLSDHMSQGQTLIHLLTAVAMRGSAHLSIEALNRAGAHIEDVYSTSQAIPTAERWVQALDFERIAMGDQCFQILLDGSQQEFEYFFGEATIRATQWRGFGLIRWFFEYDYATYLELMADAREHATLQPYQLGEVEAEVEQSMLQAKNEYRIITSILTPATLPVQKRIYQGTTFDRLAQTGLALTAYHREHEQYPESLNTLIPSYLAEMPIDPFSGKALIYRKVEDGYALYSVGYNLTDDQGVQNYDEKNEGDLIWTGSGSVLEGTYEEW